MLPAIAGGIATIGGALIGAHGQSQTNAANAQEAQRTRDFQERMRSTQYQTAVDDMRKAGLNPALAYQQGGAGNVSGASAQFQNPAAHSAESAASAVQAFQAMRRTAAEIEQITAQTDKTRQEAQLVGTQRLLANLASELGHRTFADAIERIKAESRNTVSTAREAAASATIRQLGIPEAEAIAGFYRSALGKASPYINAAGDVGGALTGIALKMRALRLKGVRSGTRTRTRVGKTTHESFREEMQ